jgi:hypothetical protein
MASNTRAIIFTCACCAAVAPRRKSFTAAYAGFVCVMSNAAAAPVPDLPLPGDAARFILSFFGSIPVLICCARAAAAPAAVPTVWPVGASAAGSSPSRARSATSRSALRRHRNFSVSLSSEGNLNFVGSAPPDTAAVASKPFVATA